MPQAQLHLETVKAEKERNEEEKERVISQLLKQLKEMEHENQVGNVSICI